MLTTLPTMSANPIHTLKKIGRYTIMKFLVINEIHVCIKKDNELIKGMQGIFTENENSKATSYYNDLCLYAMVEHTKEIREKGNFLKLF